jgi:cytochrome c oxidase subunit 4
MSDNHTHIVSYKEHLSTFAGLIFLTIMTVVVSVYGANLYSLSVLTALTIATTKALVVAFYFMHLKYDHKMYQIMIAVVVVLFLVFIILTLSDYLLRHYPMPTIGA